MVIPVATRLRQRYPISQAVKFRTKKYKIVFHLIINNNYFRILFSTASSIDRGSHYVCVNLPEGRTKAGDRYSTFWTITGQARNPEKATTWPLPGPWCICEWAYASMLEKHGKVIFEY